MSLTLQLGEPTEHRGIAITPLFPTRNPIAHYVTIGEALAEGLTIEEVPGERSVPELTVANPSRESVLLYDGEELAGGRRSRILTVSVLVGPGARLQVPVSCVEEGRRQAQSTVFEATPSIASHADLHRRTARLPSGEPLAPGAAPGEAWDEVRGEPDRTGVRSGTLKNRNTVEGRRAALAALEIAFPLQPGQCGAVVAIGDDLVLDCVSRPDAFSHLWPRLRKGYLIDALERLDEALMPFERIAGFVDEVADAVLTRGPSPGLGEDVRLRGPGVVGSGLELDGERVQLSACSSDGVDPGVLGARSGPGAYR